MSSKLWEKASKEKILEPKELFLRCSQWKKEGKTLVTLNGSFDLMHAGHLQQIYEASLLGDLLIVGLNSDASIKKYKSTSRPIIPLVYRMQMMAALMFVDYVSYFDETDPIQFLSKVKPDIHVNGPEYGENCIEADIVKQNGGKMYITTFVPGLSTTKILEKIKQCD